MFSRFLAVNSYLGNHDFLLKFDRRLILFIINLQKKCFLKNKHPENKTPARRV